MANLVQATVRQKVRRRLDEVTFDGVANTTDSDVDFYSLSMSHFSDDDLDMRMEFAARNLAANVRAEYLPDLIETVAPARFLDHYPIRLLGSRVKVTSDTYGEKRASRRTFLGHRTLEARGYVTTEEDPAYVYEDHMLKVFPDPVDTGSSTLASVDILRWPGSFHGQLISTKNIGVEELDDRFENAIIERTLFYCYVTTGAVPLAQEAQKRYLDSIKKYAVPRQRV